LLGHQKLRVCPSKPPAHGCVPALLPPTRSAPTHHTTTPPRHTQLLSPPQLQEDAHAAVLDLADGGTKSAMFAVLDGHGGAEVARFVANHLVRAAQFL